ncbi:hypothetical protein ANCDUO_19205 [Ancylostoma duodenale]|uniref:Uncharacterized protein n=1 Tax=Ancylostoma duodenale TaxID=51022 RepID=A0A0C2C357_9BILA|nr:hypothetical protein ANCDUO_19205 [Ancylostoma duodenale]
MSDQSGVNEELETMQVNGDHKEEEQKEDLVTPWDVSASSATGVDYDKLIGKVMIHSVASPHIHLFFPCI